MSPEDLLAALRGRPFEPFRIHLTDGTSFDVRHPAMVYPGRRSFILGFGASEQSPFLYERYQTVSLLHVVRLEPLAQPATGNGPAAG